LILTRLIRLGLAIAFLATAQMGIAVQAHALCDTSQSAAEHDSDSHQHSSAAVDPSAGVEAQKGDDDGGARDGKSGGMVLPCHGGIGCPGCAVAAETLLRSPSAIAIVFRHSPVSGQSAESDHKLRPPKFS
jgi:hypothetical protein